MHKKISFQTFLLLVVAVLLASSCDERTKNMRSLSRMLSDEKKNIERFIGEKGFKVEKGVADQTVFEEGIYYHFDNNLYLRVIEKGTTRPEAGKTRIVVRFKGFMFGEKTTVEFDNLSIGGFQDTEFLYIEHYDRGAIHFKLMPPAPGKNLNAYMCEGIAFPMSLLGDGAKVSLIIPFLIGPDRASQQGTTMYCEEVRYQFFQD